MTSCNNLFWTASIDDIKNGFIETDDQFICIICGEKFTKGEIHKINEKFYDARMAAVIHIKSTHTSMLDYILNMNSAFTGISEIQKEVISLFAQKIPDKEIASTLKVSPSTIRNHRYKLREKEKQAKVFLAMMELLNSTTSQPINTLEKTKLCDPPKTATTVDDRFNISEDEKLKICKGYFDENGKLKQYPSREKRKIIVLEAIAKNFSPHTKYTEKQVNTILERIYDDYGTLRRALIEYGFLDRTNNCSAYWVKY